MKFAQRKLTRVSVISLKILLGTLLLFLSGCSPNFKSLEDAKTACAQWADTGIKIRVNANVDKQKATEKPKETELSMGWEGAHQVAQRIINHADRFCVTDAKNKQVIGKEYNTQSITRQPITLQEYKTLAYSVRKNFRY